MTSFALKPLDGGEDVSVPNGKITVGRGPFLRIIDKRVSRHHAMIEVSGSIFKVLPIHTNPTFYKGPGVKKFEPLERDQPKELQDGDCIAFLPNDLVFKVLKKDNSFIENHDEAKINGDQINHRKKEIKIVNEESEGTNAHQIGKWGEEKEADVHPLKKTRNLPSWMANSKDQTPAKTSKKGDQTKDKKNKTSSKTKLVPGDEVEKKGECNDLKDTDDVNEEDKNISNYITVEEREEAVNSTVTKGELKNKKRKHSEKEGSDQATKQGKPLPTCPFGNHCYRKNPDHFKEYSHDEQSVQSGIDETHSEDESELPECPYGISCYRRNPQYRKEYRHTETPKRQERRTKRKTESRNTENDDDAPNDYDFEDSFINDESESSCEPSEHSDSDWQPDGEETGDEDVRQLLSEARDFAKNKKMQRP